MHEDFQDGVDLEFSPKEFTQFAIRHKGEPIDLDRRPWLEDIYDLPVTPVKVSDSAFGIEEEYRRKMLLVFGRQSEKSTTIGNQVIALSNLIPFLRSLYVSASDTQMREFSDERLRAVIATSPVLAAMTGRGIKGHLQTQNVQTKRWVNESKIALRAAYRNADRVRGISSDLLTIDELQDIIIDILPVIEEVLFHSELDGGPFSIYAGTPKTYDNALEFYWGRHSTQNEWVTKCSRCGTWALIDEDHIKPDGLRCKKCSTEINPVDGLAQWARMGVRNAEWEGFHLCQPIVIYAYRNHPDIFARMWQGLLIKQKRYSRQKWMNEVMGRSHDAGLKPVSMQEVRDCCVGDYELIYEPSSGIKQGHSWAGIDWGTGDVSYSILSIWNYDSRGRFRCIFAKKYEGRETDPDYVVEDMIRWIRLFNVNLVGADWGFGFHTNNLLKKRLGAQKVMLYQYTRNMKEKVKWDKQGHKFICHRSQVMQDFFTLIKKGPKPGGIAFFNWGEFEKFARDILAVFSEYDERGGMIVFNHPPGVPDDFLHTGVLALLVSQFDHRRPDLHAPGTGQKFKHRNMPS